MRWRTGPACYSTTGIHSPRVLSPQRSSISRGPSEPPAAAVAGGERRELSAVVSDFSGCGPRTPRASYVARGGHHTPHDGCPPHHSQLTPRDQLPASRDNCTPRGGQSVPRERQPTLALPWTEPIVNVKWAEAQPWTEPSLKWAEAQPWDATGMFGPRIPTPNRVHGTRAAGAVIAEAAPVHCPRVVSDSAMLQQAMPTPRSERVVSESVVLAQSVSTSRGTPRGEKHQVLTPRAGGASPRPTPTGVLTPRGGPSPSPSMSVPRPELTPMLRPEQLQAQPPSSGCEPALMGPDPTTRFDIVRSLWKRRCSTPAEQRWPCLSTAA
eukprot:NODE_11406_length_1289_cov_2.008606.p1 GENE.NODE_11406_length_1289_cov_2.008606~~NODE_11406_length_1289_cov_2.008606.p1  ORF type:complete len:324 (+),score=69.52 NODE_11406_length_1289_cov_2.008606:74-1045(+)